MRLEEIMGAILGRMPLEEKYGLIRILTEIGVCYFLSNFEIEKEEEIEWVISAEEKFGYMLICTPRYEEIIKEILQEKNIYYTIGTRERNSIFRIFLEKFSKSGPIQ